MEFNNNFDYSKDIEITPAFARIHAHICGDGCIYKVRTNRSKKELIQHPRKNTVRNRFHIRYFNNDISLLKQFIKDVHTVFNRRCCLNLKNNYIDVQGKWLYDIFKFLGAGKSHEWFISDKILSSSNEVIIEWIKSFFDDEVYVPLKRRCIEVGSVNKKGLNQIKKLLFSLGIISIIHGPYWYKGFFSYRLYIDSKNVRKYHELVGFTSLKKKRRLDNLLR